MVDSNNQQDDVLDRPNDEVDGNIYDAGGTALSDLAAERCLIGQLVTDPQRFDDVRQEVVSEDFFFILHRRIFECFVKAAEEGWSVSSASLVEALGGDPKAILIDGMTTGQYIARLIVDADMAVDPIEMALSIHETSERRAVGAADDVDMERGRPFTSTMGLKLWSDQNDPGEEYDYIVEDLIPEREGVVVMGESQTGKSFLVNHLGMCVAQAKPFFGRRVLEPMWVIWLAYEAGRGATARMRAYRRFHDLSIEKIPFAVLTVPAKLWPAENAVAQLVEEINGIARSYFPNIKPGLVIVDTHNAGTPGASEIDSEVTSKIRENYKAIIAGTGASLIIVGHVNAAGKHRGNEQLTNNIDTIIRVSKKTSIDGRMAIQLKDDDGREIRSMKVLKQREGRQGDEHDFILREVEDGTLNRYGKKRTSCVVVAPNIAVPLNDDQPTTNRADGSAGVRPTKQEALFMNCLMECLDEHGVAAPAELGLPRSIGKVVEYDHVKALMSSKMLREDDNTEEGRKRHRERVKSAVRRSRENLQHLKVIGCTSPFIWWAGRPVRGVKATQPKPQTLFDQDQGSHLSADDISGLY